MLAAFSKIFVNRGRLSTNSKTHAVFNQIRIDSDYSYGNDEDSKIRVQKLFHDLSKKSLIDTQHKKVFFEIGFGTGDNILHLLKNALDAIIIGCDPFTKGALQLAAKIHQNDIHRVHIACQPAGFVLNNAPSESIDKIFVLFPDPWHKTRHNKRRIFSFEFLYQISRVLKHKGELYFASDNLDYSNYVLELLNTFEDYIQKQALNNFGIFEKKSSFDEYPSELAVTKFMRKATNPINAIKVKKISCNS